MKEATDMSKIKLRICIFLFSVLPIMAFAGDACELKGDSVSKYFKNTLSMSKEIAKTYCVETNKVQLGQSVELWKATILEEADPLIIVGINLTPHIEKLAEGANDPNTAPSFGTARAKNIPTFYVVRSGLPVGTIDDETDKKCLSLDKYKVRCYEVIKDMQEAVNPYKESKVIPTASTALKKLKLTTQQWENYFTKARSQTILELWLNTQLYKDEILKPGFAPPPEYQVIALHPNILMENVSAANQGSRFKTALGIEWLGINYWDKQIPLGISLMSSYSDRAGVKSVGNGVQINLYNIYSIGVTKHQSKTGFFVSLDLLKFAEDKESQLKQYQQTIDNLNSRVGGN